MIEQCFSDGKYKVLLNTKTGVCKALRYNQEWRDLTGDELILALCMRLNQLELAMQDIKEVIGK